MLKFFVAMELTRFLPCYCHSENSVSAGGKEPHVRAKAPRILIVDDDPDICDLLRSMLLREGFLVRTAGDGASALELIKWNDFDLMITDIGLPPPMDGVETVRRARECRPALRSLFISGGGECRWDDPDRDDFVSKPFQEREVLGCVWELFSRGWPGHSLHCR
jgi:DNA-binding response OmpR family regulator